MLLGNQTVLAVGVSIFLKDNFSGPAAAVAKQLGGLDAASTKMVTTLNALRNYYVGLTTAGVAASAMLGIWYKSGAEFDHAMRGVQVVTEATANDFAALNREVKATSASSLFDPLHVAKLAQAVGQAGFSAKETQAMMRPTVELAQATLSDTETAYRFLIATVNTFGIQKDNIKEITEVTNLLGTAANKSSTDLGEMFETFKYSSSTARFLGLTVKDLGALAMAVSNAGLRGSMGGTSLENMLRYLNRAIRPGATKRAKDALDMLGLSWKNFVTPKGDLKPMVDILQLFRDTLPNLPTIYQQGAMEAIFGVRGQRAAGVLIKNLGDYRKMIEELNSPQNMSQLSNFIMSGPWAQLQMFFNSFKLFVIEFSQLLRPAVALVIGPLKVIFDTLKSGLEWLNSLSWWNPFKWIPSVLAGMLLFKVASWAAKSAVAGIQIGIYRMASAQKAAAAAQAGQASVMQKAWQTQIALADAYIAQLRIIQKLGWSNAFTPPAGIGTIGGKPVSPGPINVNGVGGIAGATAAALGIQYAVNQKGHLYAQYLPGNAAGKRAGAFAPIDPAIKAQYQKSAAPIPIAGPLTKAGTWLSRIGGLMAGPWGWAIMAGAMIIPSLIQAIRGNTSSIDSNTEAANKLSESQEDFLNMLAEKVLVKESASRSYSYTGGGNEFMAHQRWQQYQADGAKGRFMDTRDPQQLVFYFDGEKKFEKVVKDMMSRTFHKIAM